MSKEKSRPKAEVQKSKEMEELEEMKNLLQRLQADFENYRKRSQKEKEDFGRYLNADLLMRVLPVLDNFELAFKHQPVELETNEWVHGIWHIQKQLEQVLADEGATEIPALGQRFDPSLHDALEEVSSEKPEGEIVEVVLKGYQIGDKILRHVRVKVSVGNNK
jgi:molecular chaperone GrpE